MRGPDCYWPRIWGAEPAMKLIVAFLVPDKTQAVTENEFFGLVYVLRCGVPLRLLVPRYVGFDIVDYPTTFKAFVERACKFDRPDEIPIGIRPLVKYRANLMGVAVEMAARLWKLSPPHPQHEVRSKLAWEALGICLEHCGGVKLGPPPQRYV
jgi:hypothetical protein